MRKIDIVAWGVCGTGGAIVFSQGVSFARWNTFQGIGHFIDLHAAMLAVAGVSLCCATFVIGSLKARIEKLERIVAGGER